MVSPQCEVLTSATTLVHGMCWRMSSRSLCENNLAFCSSVSTAKKAFTCGILQRKELATHRALAS